MELEVPHGIGDIYEKIRVPICPQGEISDVHDIFEHPTLPRVASTSEKRKRWPLMTKSVKQDQGLFSVEIINNLT